MKMKCIPASEAAEQLGIPTHMLNGALAQRLGKRTIGGSIHFSLREVKKAQEAVNRYGATHYAEFHLPQLLEDHGMGIALLKAKTGLKGVKYGPIVFFPRDKVHNRISRITEQPFRNIIEEVEGVKEPKLKKILDLYVDVIEQARDAASVAQAPFHKQLGRLWLKSQEKLKRAHAALEDKLDYLLGKRLRDSPETRRLQIRLELLSGFLIKKGVLKNLVKPDTYLQALNLEAYKATDRDGKTRGRESLA
ncbi:MAG: hypothetical protein AABX01_01450 [Candidatus Micrarchaeota archaeon]